MEISAGANPATDLSNAGQIHERRNQKIKPYLVNHERRHGKKLRKRTGAIKKRSGQNACSFLLFDLGMC